MSLVFGQAFGPRAVSGRSIHSRTVYCNANNGSDSRVRFQASRDASTALHRPTTDSGKLWFNAGLSHGRRQTTQVSCGYFCWRWLGRYVEATAVTRPYCVHGITPGVCLL